MKRKHIIIILIPLFLLLLSFRLFVFNQEFYREQFRENYVYNKYNESHVSEVNNNLIEYLKDNKELETKYYTQREILHLKDVKKLIVNATRSLYLFSIIFLSFLIYIIYKKMYKTLGKILFKSGILSLIIYISFLLIFMINFEKNFIIFHEVFFNNDLWILNNSDILINLFPQEFFISIFRKIIITSIIISLLFILFGKIIEKAYKHTI